MGESVQVPLRLAADETLPPRAKACFMAVASHGWRDDLTVADVAETMGASWLTAQRAIRDLVEAGWLAEDMTQGPRITESERLM